MLSAACLTFQGIKKRRKQPMTSKSKTGEEGEQKAAEFLASKGFEIVARNFRYKRSEIDLIAKKENWLVFVEVKTRSSTAFGYPEQFVDYHKKRMIFEGALHYMREADWQGNVRYDIVSVTLGSSGADVVHIEDAFY
jgi:putative endonuclease